MDSEGNFKGDYLNQRVVQVDLNRLSVQKVIGGAESQYLDKARYLARGKLDPQVDKAFPEYQVDYCSGSPVHLAAPTGLQMPTRAETFSTKTACKNSCPKDGFRLRLGSQWGVLQVVEDRRLTSFLMVDRSQVDRWRFKRKTRWRFKRNRLNDGDVE